MPIRSGANEKSEPLPEFIVAGLSDFQIMLSQMLVAMNKEIPEPSP